jgi:putative transcriptional regulator
VSTKKKNNLGSRLIQAAREARAIARGEADPSTYRVYVPANIDVGEIRRSQGLTQEEFAARYGCFAIGSSIATSLTARLSYCCIAHV